MWKRILWAAFAIPILAGVSPAAQEAPLPGKPPGEATANDPPDPLRFGPVKLGLDTLVRPETATNFSLGNFSFTPGNDEARILLRLRPSVTVTPSENLTARVEGQWYAFYDDKDFSLFSLYQGYVDGVLPHVKGVSLKAGRQELVYGSTFLLGADTFYDGLTFDAAKAMLHPADNLTIDLFGGRYVKKWSGGIEGKLYGIYGTYSPRETLSIDLYGFRDTGGAGETHVGGEHEETWSVGTRLSGRIARNVAFEVEPVYQFGRKNIDGTSHIPIRAYGGHADLTLDPAPGRYPGKVFLSYAYGSGDGDPGGKFTEFHNPNNDTPLIGGMNVIGDLGGLTVGTATASGLQVFTAGGGVDLTEKLNLSLDGHCFRANKVPAGFGKGIGIEMDLILTCKLKENITVLFSGNRFFTGDFFKDATGSGKDISYAYLQAQATF